MSSNSFSLIVSIPGQEPTRHDLGEDSISIGRGPDNGIQVLVSEVSVNHAELKESSGSYAITDKGSTNGSKVNDVPVTPEGKELSPMDIVLLGNTVKTYFVSSAVLDATPIAELIASIEESKAKPATAPVSVAPAKPAVSLPAKAPAAGASTVKLDQVRPGAPAPGPAKPKAPASPAAPKLPSPAATPVGTPAAPKAPPEGGPAAPKPIAPIPLKRPGGAPAPAAPSIPLPGAAPKKPSE